MKFLTNFLDFVLRKPASSAVAFLNIMKLSFLNLSKICVLHFKEKLCDNHNCRNGATCKAGFDNYSCICPTGFTGSKCEC